ncbi:hypothetical protein HZB06_00325 [Candidatus Wolfebacteria bacterium]|nr:hypothetical protein [Candidatus Wolfebacteria bacterium]
MTVKNTILFVLAAVAIIGVVYLIATKSYPAAIVDFSMISAKSFEKDFQAAIVYYEKALKTYNHGDAAVIGSEEIKKEIQRAVLDKLIDNAVVRRELTARIGKKELESIIENKIRSIEGKSSEIEEGIKNLYGFSLEDFKTAVLRPMAEEEILGGRFFSENKNFDEWLKNERTKIRVIILIPGFKWEDGQLKTEN